jgi:ribosomal-protein-alanine N-acetyltransferase
MSLQLKVDDNYSLSPVTENDIPSFVKYLGDKEIYDRTLMVPYPYRESDGRWFVDYCQAQSKNFGHTLNFGVRTSQGELIGVAGYHGKNIHPAIAHKDEVGYWIAKPFWKQGIMTKVLPVLIKYGEDVRGIRRFEAPIYAFNVASEKLLRKCGFREEGYLSKAYFKNGQFMDGKMFALVK